MTIAVERLMALRSTRAFIDAQPTNVVFTRHTWSQNAAAGMDDSVETLNPQVVRIDRSELQHLRRAKQHTVVGEMQRTYDRIVAMPDADILVDDTFSYEGNEYRVTGVSTCNFRLSAAFERDAPANA